MVSATVILLRRKQMRMARTVSSNGKLTAMRRATGSIKVEKRFLMQLHLVQVN